MKRKSIESTCLFVQHTSCNVRFLKKIMDIHAVIHWPNFFFFFHFWCRDVLLLLLLFFLENRVKIDCALQDLLNLLLAITDSFYHKRICHWLFLDSEHSDRSSRWNANISRKFNQQHGTNPRHNLKSDKLRKQPRLKSCAVHKRTLNGLCSNRN